MFDCYSSGKLVAIDSRWAPATFALAVSLALVAMMISTDRRAAIAAGGNSMSVAPATSNQKVSLRDRLVTGLRARLTPEIAFIERVALAVRLGLLPQRLVDQTFFWARHRAASSRSGRKHRPIIYFQAAMTARAKRLGVVL